MLLCEEAANRDATQDDATETPTIRDRGVWTTYEQ
jgi:hypothetical protein